MTQEATCIIGVDEAGRGPVMGPLVVAGIRTVDDGFLREMGIRDSKELSPKKREDLFELLMEGGRVLVALRVIGAEDVDRLRVSKTMNEIELEAFGSVVRELYRQGDRVFVDAADVRSDLFGEGIRDIVESDLEIICEHKADAKYPVVSAASVVAKVTRDRGMLEIEEELRRILDIPVGSGYSSDRVTLDFMEKWIKQEGNLPPHTRRSWETAVRLLSMAKNTSLDDFGVDESGARKGVE